MKDITFRSVMLKGQDGDTISGIEKIEAEGGVMKMRITLSSGATVDFDVEDVPDQEVVDQWIDQKLGWKKLQIVTHPDRSQLPPVDISSVINTANEFFVAVYMTVSDSGSYEAATEFIIPNLQTNIAPRNKVDYIGGWNYDSSYNGCVYVRLNRDAKTISLLSNFTKVTGSSGIGATMAVYYR